MSHHGKLPSFQLLWNGYPDFPEKSETENARAVRKLIGGACDNEDYANTCAMRLSAALLYAGITLPHKHPGLLTVRGGNGIYKDKWIALRHAELSLYLKNHLWGHPQVFHSKLTNKQAVEPDTYVLPPPELSGKRGVISFFNLRLQHWHGGHLDIFDGERGECKHAGYFMAETYWLWEAKS
jgi:hypothetical protein